MKSHVSVTEHRARTKQALKEHQMPILSLSSFPVVVAVGVAVVIDVNSSKEYCKSHGKQHCKSNEQWQSHTAFVVRWNWSQILVLPLKEGCYRCKESLCKEVPFLWIGERGKGHMAWQEQLSKWSTGEVLIPLTTSPVSITIMAVVATITKHWKKN